MYELHLSKAAKLVYDAADTRLVQRLHRCFEQLRVNPHRHPNIHPLTGRLASRWRYRLGNTRIVYRIEENPRRVTVLLIIHRARAYRGRRRKS